VATNKQGITGIKEQLQKQFDARKEELKAFQDKYKITVKGEEAGQPKEPEGGKANSGATQGILA